MKKQQRPFVEAVFLALVKSGRSTNGAPLTTSAARKSLAREAVRLAQAFDEEFAAAILPNRTLRIKRSA